jgi:hypothetical protein
VWELSTARPRDALVKDNQDAPIRSVAFDRSSGALWSVSDNGLIACYLLETGKIIRTINLAPLRICAADFTTDADHISVLTYLPDANTDPRPFLSAMEYRILSIDLVECKIRRRHSVQGTIRCFAGLPDNTGVLLGKEDGALLIRHTGEESLLNMFTDHEISEVHHPLLYKVHVAAL